MTAMSEQQADPAVDPAEYRRVLGHFPTGVTVVTAQGPDRPVGVAIGSFASISLDPPLVGFFLGKESNSWPPMQASGHFCVNVLGSDQRELCGIMASKSDDKFSGIFTSEGHFSGAPILPDVHAVIECRISDVVDTGDHILVIGRVLALSTPNGESDPMVFYKGQYGSFGS